MKRSLRVLLVTCALLVLLPDGGRSCAIGYGVFFWNSHAPGPALPDYLAGNLGILEPSRYARTPGPLLEVVAYRHLSGLGLSDEDRAKLTAFLEPKWKRADSSFERWEDARSLQLPPRSYERVSPYRRVRQNYGKHVYYRSVRNCYDDAFGTAVRTLQNRRQRYGGDELAEWLRGQDKVFLACRAPSPVPPAAQPSWSKLLQKDRAYQIAASHFYSMRYDEALTLFRQIAHDEESPWQPISTYLVARTLFRRQQGDDSKEAQKILERILQDPSLAEVHGSADLLLGYFLARNEPRARRRDLAARMVTPRLDLPSEQLLIDYGYLRGRTQDDEDPIEDVTEWINAFRAGADQKAQAAARWSEHRSLPWLVLAAAGAEAGDPLLGEILAAIDAVPSTSPGYLTLAYHQGRLLADTGRYEESRALLNRLLRDPALSVSDHNRILALQTHNAPDLETFLSYAPMRAALIGYYDGGRGSFPSGREGDGLDGYREQRLMFGDEALFVLNRYFSPDLLLEAAASETLPGAHRLRLARAAWVRAFVTDNEAVSEAAAKLLMRLEEEPQSTGLRLYLAARPGPDRQFMAALHLLHNTEMSPWLHRFRNSYSLRLWCSGESLRHFYGAGSAPPPAPSFIDPADAREAGLQELEPGTTSVGRIVLDRAVTHPRDDRLPEALHLVVRATRRACGVESQKEVSRTAFRLLHTRYRGSLWTERTPYWFD